MSEFIFTKIELELAVAIVQSQRPAAETTEVEACLTTFTEDVGHG